MYITRRTPVPESFACLFRQYSVAAACHTESMAVPLRLVLAKNPSQRGVCPPILRCPGLPYTKYGCAGASRLGKKIHPKARRSFPILRCGGLPYTKYGCAGAPPGFYRAVRLSKKPVIASRCAHWRGNPFLKRTNSVLFAGFCLKRYGFPRRFAPRNDRGEVYRHAAPPGFYRAVFCCYFAGGLV